MEDLSFGQWVQRRRRSLLTYAELADRPACSPAVYRTIEEDQRRPSGDMADQLARVPFPLPSAKPVCVGVAELHRLRRLEDENRTLTQLVADLTLDT